MESLPVGVPVLNLLKRSIPNVQTRILENEFFDESVQVHPGLVAGGTTHLNFLLVPKSPWSEAGLDIPVTIQVEAPALSEVYERTFNLGTIVSTDAHQRTFVSPIDGSVQYYGVRTPTSVREGTEYGLVLSLHELSSYCHSRILLAELELSHRAHESSALWFRLGRVGPAERPGQSGPRHGQLLN